MAPARYAPLWEVGRGGMAVVHAARDTRLGRLIALKRPRDLAHVHHRLCLRREARLLATVSHPNVVAIHDAASLWDEPFIALELVDGPNLACWLAAEPRHWRHVLAVFLAVGRGLAAVHAAGLVHRDVKPSNILIGSDGRPRLADFGLAVAVLEPAEATLRVSGTPGYMAPEQTAGEQADARTDQYSFALSLHEALWNDRPLGAAAPARPLAPAGIKGRVPLRLCQIVRRGVELDRAQRHPGMLPLVADLARAAALG
ncbi:MAG TPA: serine/threonine-protein kinase [Kofleriaceae bacterium]|nr:serine/threonine-protein kinase [Kofleriaceae bacterium]